MVKEYIDANTNGFKSIYYGTDKEKLMLNIL